MSVPEWLIQHKQIRARETAAPWPDGVIARYLTVVGAALSDPTLVVDVHEEIGQQYRNALELFPGAPVWRTDVYHTVTCRACDEMVRDFEMSVRNQVAGGMRPDQEEEVARAGRSARHTGQAHAEKCRAMPRPKAGGR